MFLGIIVSIYWCFQGVYYLIYMINRSNYSIIDVLAVVFVNFFGSLFISWYIINMVVMYYKFNKEWKKENTCDVSSNDKNIEDKERCNSCCCISWTFCCCGGCIVYYCCFNDNNRATVDDNRQDSLSNDDKGNINIIGNKKGEFAISWRDYEAYTQGISLETRDLSNIGSRLNIDQGLTSESTSPAASLIPKTITDNSKAQQMNEMIPIPTNEDLDT